ncbi:MAG: hypothetical protein MPJ50_09150 [Pirellulales bacterium]|nr:hypothetical protein [Pirellulales bacterium]
MDQKEQIEVAIDEITGKSFELVPEDRVATIAASISAGYLLCFLLVFLWFTVDLFSERYTFFIWLNPNWVTPQISVGGEAHPVEILIYMAVAASAFTGGALGGIINEFRSLIVWHAERKAFGARFLWKGIIAPWIGGVLGIFTFAVLNTGIVAMGAAIDTSEASPGRSAFFAFALGSLAGFGSHKVTKWFDVQVARLFNSEQAKQNDGEKSATEESAKNENKGDT